MKYSRNTMQFVKLYMLLLILISGLGIYLYPKQYAAPSSSYYKEYDDKRDKIYRDIIKNKTQKEMEFRVNTSIANASSDDRIYLKKRAIQSFNENSSRLSGAKIIKERASHGLSKDGVVTRDSSMSVAQRRASSLSEWTKKNFEKKAN